MVRAAALVTADWRTGRMSTACGRIGTVFPVAGSMPAPSLRDFGAFVNGLRGHARVHGELAHRGGRPDLRPKLPDPVHERGGVARPIDDEHAVTGGDDLPPRCRALAGRRWRARVAARPP